MNRDDVEFGKAIFIGLFIPVVVILLVIAGVEVYKNIYGSKSLAAVTNADFTINDGRSMEALDHAIITDMETGIQYIYFKGYGVSPYIDEDGNVSKVTE